MTDEGPEQPEAEAEPVYFNRGPNKEGMVNEYLPGEDDWTAKTHLDIDDPHAIAALSQFDQLFPEVEDLQEPIDQFITEFLKGRTSISGQSRDEYSDIFVSMFGGNPNQSEAASAFVGALAGDLNEDD